MTFQAFAEAQVTVGSGDGGGLCDDKSLFSLATAIFAACPLANGEFLPVLDLQYSINFGMLRFSFCVPQQRFFGALFREFSSRCKTTAFENGGGP
jgi:hypothetical protein